jgi:hypothetical protein
MYFKLIFWEKNSLRTRYRCATESLEIAVRNYNFNHQQISTNTLTYGYCFITIHEIELLIANCNLMSRKLFFSQRRGQIHFSLFRFLHFTCTITATKHFETSTGFEAVRGDANIFFKIITNCCSKLQL